jgi:hypothetical protein
VLVVSRGRVDRDLRPRVWMYGQICSLEHHASVWRLRKRFLSNTLDVFAETGVSQALTMARLFDNDSLVSIRVVAHVVFCGRGKKAWLLGYG